MHRTVSIDFSICVIGEIGKCGDERERDVEYIVYAPHSRSARIDLLYRESC